VGARTSRRRLLKAAIAFGVVAAAGSIAAVVRTRGYEAPVGVTLASLDAWQWVVVRALARRVCATDAPEVVTADEVDVAGFVDSYAAKMPARMRRDLGRFLAYVEHVAPVALRSASRFSRLPEDAQDRVLGALEAHDNPLLRGGFEGVKALLFMGYYRDPRTWRHIGYGGPLVARAAGP
jgi:hypothetical protein